MPACQVREGRGFALLLVGVPYRVGGGKEGIGVVYTFSVATWQPQASAPRSLHGQGDAGGGGEADSHPGYCFEYRLSTNEFQRIPTP